MKQIINRNRITKILLCISLFASITNFLPVSVTFCLLVFLLPIVGRKITEKSLLFSLMSLYIIFFVSVLIYHPESLYNFSFFRRDGNFFITFLPLLLLVQQRIWFNTEIIVRKFIYFATIINLICMIFPRIGINPNNIIIIEGTTINHFLFFAHNAAAGFVAVLLALNVGFFLAGKSEQTRKKMLICCLINLIALVDSGSRGTLLAFVIAIIMFLIMKKGLVEKSFRKPIDLFVFLVVLIASILVVTLVADEKMYKLVLNLFHISSRSFAINDRLTNLWPKAIKLFSASPIVGTGYGSFNDEPIFLSVIIHGILAINQPKNYIFSDAHAHNTFFHVMAETGIVGLFVLLLFLYCLRDKVTRIHSKPLRYGLYIGLCINVFSSFTEHRLFTPSQMIPYVLVLGMIISEERSEKFRKIYRDRHLNQL